MNTYLGDTLNFMKSNFLDIFLLSLFMLIGLIVYTMHFSENNKESMVNMEDLKTANKCDTLKGDSTKIESYCTTLGKGKCKIQDCCVLLGSDNEPENQRCVAGNKSGPTYKTDEEGNDIEYDEYYYLQNKYSIKN